MRNLNIIMDGYTGPSNMQLQVLQLVSKFMTLEQPDFQPAPALYYDCESSLPKVNCDSVTDIQTTIIAEVNVVQLKTRNMKLKIS